MIDLATSTKRHRRRPADLSLEALEAQGRPVSTWDIPRRDERDRIEIFEGDPQFLLAVLMIESALESNPHLMGSLQGRFDRALARWERAKERERCRRTGERMPRRPPPATRWREMYADDLTTWPRLQLALDGSLEMVFLEAGLPAEESKVVRWCLNGYSVERAAEVMGISRQFARSLHARGMQRIRELVHPDAEIASAFDVVAAV